MNKRYVIQIWQRGSTPLNFGEESDRATALDKGRGLHQSFCKCRLSGAQVLDRNTGEVFSFSRERWIKASEQLTATKQGTCFDSRPDVLAQMIGDLESTFTDHGHEAFSPEGC